jgi:hypothetical protein
MHPFLTKRPRIENDGPIFRQIASARSKFSHFNTTQYVTRFVIERLDNERELGQLINQIIDKAYEDTHREYGRHPTMYNVLIDGQTLNQPIAVSIYERIPGLDVEIVILLFKNKCIYYSFKILNEIEKLAQSDKFLDLLNNPLTIIVTACIFFLKQILLEIY